MFKIGIRYCGGCNASYDRKEFVEKLIKELEGIYKFEIAKEYEVYDYLILVCGCLNCCVSHEKYISKYEKIYIKDIDDYNRLMCKIQLKK